MSEPFASVEDVELLWRPLTEDEETRAAAILPLISDTLRTYAADVGKDLDYMAEDSTTYPSVLKLVTVDIVARVLRQNTTGDAMTQESQSALGYSWSGTYAVPGGGIAAAIMNNDLKRLGLLQQEVGAFMLWGKGDMDTEQPPAPVPVPGRKINIIGADGNAIGQIGG